jgi:hypothetical protein
MASLFSSDECKEAGIVTPVGFAQRLEVLVSPGVVNEIEVTLPVDWPLPDMIFEILVGCDP